MCPPNIPARIMLTSKPQVKSLVSDENNDEGHISVKSRESNIPPSKPSRGRKQSRNGIVERSKKHLRSTSTGLKVEAKVIELSRSKFDSLLDRIVKSELKNIVEQGQIDALKRANYVNSNKIANLNKKLSKFKILLVQEYLEFR